MSVADNTVSSNLTTCSAVAFALVASGAALALTGGYDFIVEDLRKITVTLGQYWALIAASLVAGASLLCIFLHSPRLRQAILDAWAAAFVAVIVAVTIVGWLGIVGIGFGPGYPPTGSPLVGSGFLLMALGLVTLTWCRTELRRPSDDHAGRWAAYGDKLCMAWVAGSVVLFGPGALSTLFLFSPAR